MAILNNTHVDLQEENDTACCHSTAAAATSHGSSRSSDADGRSWHSLFDSTAGGSNGHRASSLSTSEIVGVSDKMRDSSVSQCSVELVDLVAGVPETKLHLAKYERDCRICHMTLDASNQESGVPIEFGCSCKDDLAAAHRHCAEAWFKIKGNKTCEICGSVASNVSGANEAELLEQWNEENDAAASAAAPLPSSETRNFFLNFLLACMVFAFVISWLFHFNVPS